VLDRGIQQNYYNDFKGSLIAGTRNNTDWGPDHATPWTSYGTGTNHGTEIQYIIDEMLYKLGTKDNIQTISYKYADADGKGSPERLLYALNDIMDYYVKEQHMNVVAINFSNWVDFYKTDNQDTIAKQNELRQEIQTAIDKAASMGIAFITTSGNDNKEAFTYSANLKNAIVVGATDINDKRGIWTADGGITEGSNYGNQVDVVAPGVNVNIFDYKGDYHIGYGTSYAAPMVTAVAAVLKSVNPELTPADIEAILKNTAKDLGPKGRDDEFGYGLIDYEKAINAALSTVQIDSQSANNNISAEASNVKHTTLVNQAYFRGQ
jgi:subtilisin family serine protease